jgi:hypothetical protein
MFRFGIQDVLRNPADEPLKRVSVIYPEASTGAGHLHEDFAYDSAGKGF